MDCAGLADAYLIGMSEGPNFDAAMERRFQEYVDHLGTVVGNDARRRGLSDYMTGLLLPGERKSMEPIAERLESGNVSRRHQSIQHFVSEASWKDGPVRERVLGRVVPAMQKRGTLEHWIVDDTTLLKSGRHGVAIQYSGLVGTTCQSACRWRPSACLRSLPARGLGARPQTPSACRGATPPHVPHQDRDGDRSDPHRRRRRPAARDRAGRCRLRRRPELPRRAEGPPMRSGSRATPCRPPQRIPPPGAPGPSRSRRAGSMSWPARGSRTTVSWREGSAGQLVRGAPGSGRSGSAP